MKKKVLKINGTGKKARLLPLLMSLCLIGSLNPIRVQAEETKTVQNMNLDASVLANSEKWSKGSYQISFGIYGNRPMYYRVLSADSNAKTLLLDCDTVLENQKYAAADNAWDSSTLKSWLDGGSFFTGTEKSALKDGVTVLTKTEAEDCYKDADARKKTGSSNEWWLKTESTLSPDIYADVVSDGEIDQYYVDTDFVGVSPALELNLTKVLYVSEEGLNKTNSLSEVTTSTNVTKWKLTLLDSSMSAGVQDKQKVTANTESGTTTVTVPYTFTGSPSQLSVMITDKAYNADGAKMLYYGQLAKINSENTDGTATFTLPSGCSESSWGTGYRVYLVAEKVNNAGVTDYAGTPTELSLSAGSDSGKEASVKITWTGMNFSYSKGTWNATQHEWENGGWTADKDCGTVTVENTGEVSVTAAFAFEANTPNDLKFAAKFKDGSTELTDSKITVVKKESKIVTVDLTGDAPTNDMNETGIGKITITLTAE